MYQKIPPPDRSGFDNLTDEMVASKVSDEELVPFANSRAVAFRGVRGLMDDDVADAYGVSVRRLNRARADNADRFPSDHAFQLTDEETAELERMRSMQAEDSYPLKGGISTSKDNKTQTTEGSETQTRGGKRKNPWFYSPETANMAAYFLHSPKAIQRSWQIIEVFTNMDRMAHGEAPSDPKYIAMVDGIAARNRETYEMHIATLYPLRIKGNNYKDFMRRAREADEKFMLALEAIGDQNKKIQETDKKVNELEISEITRRYQR